MILIIRFWSRRVLSIGLKEGVDDQHKTLYKVALPIVVDGCVKVSPP